MVKASASIDDMIFGWLMFDVTAIGVDLCDGNGSDRDSALPPINFSTEGIFSPARGSFLRG